MADDFDKNDRSWLSDDHDDNSQDNPEDDLNFDWLKGTDELPPMQNKVTKRLGITGDLDWQKANAESDNDTPDDAQDDGFDWGIFDRAGDSSQTGTMNSSGLTGQLPWMQHNDSDESGDADDSKARPSFDEQVRRAEQAAGLPPAADNNVLDWLNKVAPPELPLLDEQSDDDDETFNTAWFASLESDLEQAAVEADQMPPSTEAQEPDWLAYMEELDEGDRREAEFFEQAAAEIPDDADDWLKDFALDPIADTDDNDSIMSESTKVEKPAWLLDLEAEAQAQQQQNKASTDDLAELASLFDDVDTPAAAQQPAEVQSLPDDAFDLFGELTDEADLLDGLELDANADSTMFASLFAEDEADNAAAQAMDAPASYTDFDEDLFGSLDLLDEDDDSADASLPVSEPLFQEDAADWLQEIQTLESAVNHETVPSDIDDLDSFLASISVDKAPPPASKPLGTPAVDDFDALFADERFDALDNAEPLEESKPDRPEWLKNVRVEEISAAALVRKQQDRPLEDLPANLRALREEGQELPSSGAELAAASVVTPLVSSAASDVLRLTDVQRSGAKRLAVLAAGEAEDTHTPRASATANRLGLPRLLMAILLIAAIVAPYYVPQLRIGDAPPVSFAAGSPQQAVFDRINSLTSGERVLLAAEYSGTGTGELDDLTRVLIAHLAARGANITIASTTPTGYLHGSRLAQGAVDGFDAIYIPNSVAGLRSFPQAQQSISGTPLDNYALIVVIAESADTVRAWAEQIEPQTRAPLAYVTSAAAAPFALPYAQNAGAIGALSGYRDAYAYAVQLEQASVVVPLVRVEPTATTPPQETPQVLPSETPQPEITATQDPATEGTLTPEPVTPQVTVTDAPTESTTPAATASTPAPTVAATPTPPATATLDRFAIVTAQQAVNVREGPGTGFAAVGLLQPQERVRVIGENEDGSWFEIEFGTAAQRGWIVAFLVTIEITPGGGAYRPPLDAQFVGLVSDISQASTPPQADAAPRAPVLIEGGDDRWYSTTLGLIAAIVVIVLGNLLSLLRKLRKR